MLARISLRDAMLLCNEYLIVMSDAFLLQNNAFKRTLCTELDTRVPKHQGGWGEIYPPQ